MGKLYSLIMVGSYYYNSVHNIAWSVDGNFYKFNDVDEFVTYSKENRRILSKNYS